MAHLLGRQVMDVSPLLRPESWGLASSPHGQVQPGLTQDPHPGGGRVTWHTASRPQLARAMRAPRLGGLDSQQLILKKLLHRAGKFVPKMHLKPRLEQQGAGDALKCNPHSGEREKEHTPILPNCVQATPAKTADSMETCARVMQDRQAGGHRRSLAL